MESDCEQEGSERDGEREGEGGRCEDGHNAHGGEDYDFGCDASMGIGPLTLAAGLSVDLSLCHSATPCVPAIVGRHAATPKIDDPKIELAQGGRGGVAGDVSM